MSTAPDLVRFEPLPGRGEFVGELVDTRHRPDTPYPDAVVRVGDATFTVAHEDL